MIEFVNTAIAQFQQQSLLELFAVFLSILYVVLAAKQNIWCWPSAFVSTALFVYLFWNVTLLFQTLLNFYYIIMAVVGYLSWRKGSDEQVLVVTKLPVKMHVTVVCSGVLMTIILSLIANEWFVSEWVWLDAGTAVFSVMATVMTARKKIDSWYYWLIINPLIGYLTYQNGLYFICLLSFFYMAMSVYGFLNWRKDLNVN